MHKERKLNQTPKQYLVVEIVNNEPKCVEGPTHRAKAFKLAKERKEKTPAVRVCIARIGWDAEVALSSHLTVEDWAVTEKRLVDEVTA